MSDTDEITMVCGPVGGPGHEIAGTVIKDGTCGHQVYLAPSGQEIAEKYEKVSLICVPCALRDPNMAAHLLGRGAFFTPTQRAEFDKNFGVGESDQMIARLKAMGMTEREI